jgi:Ig-like domain CHU_C associated/Secretion system C-terminal sorting domain/Lysyl oxidase
MKIRILSLLAMSLPFWAVAQLPCTINDATGCICAQPGQTNCDLLPDITISAYGVLNYAGGPNEYPQTGAGAENGRLRITGSTPNIGYGPFTVGAVALWVCGVDTFADYNTALVNCANPKQLVHQKIYHKNGNTMSYTTRWAGSMTYHQSHGHMHVDDWATFTLRQQTSDPDPLNWTIIGDGAKVGFCLMDYGTCSGYNGHCRDSLNNILINGNFPNYNLGGGGYNCSPVEQGISVGYTDIYSEALDGMWINIPPGTCNGNYYIVIEVDPHNYFRESNERNNVCAVPFTLTQQVPFGQFTAEAVASGSTTVCAGDMVTLTATQGVSYLWSNGDTTRSIQATASGSYVCTVTAQCGSDITSPIIVTTSNSANAPSSNGATVCENTPATLTINGTGVYDWYDAPVGGNYLGTGNTFVTGPLAATTDYYVEEIVTTPGQISLLGPANGAIGTGSFSQSNGRYLQFDAIVPFTLQSVWVDAGSAGNRTIELRDAAGTTVIASITQYIPAGPSRVSIGFAVPIGTDYQLGLNGGSLADLYRNSAGATYPYTVANVARVTTSSAGPSYWFFFYDWEIQTPDLLCLTPRATVTAVANVMPTLSVAGLVSNYTTIDPAVTLLPSPAGGSFSGPGIVGNTFNPSIAGPGQHTITYTYIDGIGCEATITLSTTVTFAVSQLSAMFDVMPAVFPNPSNGRFVLHFALHGQHDVAMDIVTVTGQVVAHKSFGTTDGAVKEEMDLTKMARGVYFVELNVDGQKVRTKVVLQ